MADGIKSKPQISLVEIFGKTSALGVVTRSATSLLNLVDFRLEERRAGDSQPHLRSGLVHQAAATFGTALADAIFFHRMDDTPGMRMRLAATTTMAGRLGGGSLMELTP